MSSKLHGDNSRLYDALVERGVARKRARQLHNLALHCDYSSWEIDAFDSQYTILTLATSADLIAEYNDKCREAGATLCILSPYYTAERWTECCRIVEAHPSTTVDNRGYILIFNNHLPKQRFRL